MAKVSRPAQGHNAIGYGGRPANRPKPAYKADAAPRVVSHGTVSNPSDGPARFSGKLLVADATPKVVNL